MLCIDIGKHVGLLTKGKDYRVRRTAEGYTVMSDRGFPCNVEASCFEVTEPEPDLLTETTDSTSTESNQLLTEMEAVEFITELFSLLCANEDQTQDLQYKKRKLFQILAKRKNYKRRFTTRNYDGQGGSPKRSIIDMDEITDVKPVAEKEVQEVLEE